MGVFGGLERVHGGILAEFGRWDSSAKRGQVTSAHLTSEERNPYENPREFIANISFTANIAIDAN